jgi:hypothetical protein
MDNSKERTPLKQESQQQNGFQQWKESLQSRDASNSMDSSNRKNAIKAGTLATAGTTTNKNSCTSLSDASNRKNDGFISKADLSNIDKEQKGASQSRDARK